MEGLAYQLGKLEESGTGDSNWSGGEWYSQRPPCPSGSRYCPQPMGTLAGVPTLVVCVCADGWGNVKTRRHMFHSASSDVELGISLDVLKLKEGNRIKQ